MSGMYKRKDSFYLQAKKEGYRSRAAYKISEIVRKEALVRPGDCVIDAGAAPGGWSQVLLPLVGKKGKVAAVDILPMESLPGGNFRLFQEDLSLPSLPGRILEFFGRKADIVVSDAAPNTTGIAFTDQARSADLVRVVLSLARRTLAEGGTLLAKIFEGAEVDAVFRELQGEFEKVRRVRPAATRKESFELYLLAKGFRGDKA
ncbi:MAG: RlmE family RNA methyltransferase [Candidatus Deferrimicrobiota bacterium]